MWKDSVTRSLRLIFPPINRQSVNGTRSVFVSSFFVFNFRCSLRMSRSALCRFRYVDELSRMGASVKVEGNVAVISGVEKFTGARVNAPDLRAGAALVIAGLAAEGITIVDDIYYIERGYENLDAKLRKLGAQIEKVASEKEIQKFRLKVG